MGLPAKVLNTKHPDYDLMLPQYRALYEGGDLWHTMREMWLPRHPQEPAGTWQLRLERAAYENNVGPICDGLAGGMFAKPPIIQEFNPSWWEDFESNVDTVGTPLNSWLEQRVIDAMVGRRVYAWVRAPGSNGVQFSNLAQQQAAGALDAFLECLKAENVIDWKLDRNGRLVWIMHREVESVRETIDSPRVKVWTWTYIDGERIRVWRWRDTREEFEGIRDDDIPDEIEVEEVSSVEHKIGEMPVVHMSLTKAMHVVGKLRDPGVALLRSQNDLDWGLHRAAHALLWIRTTRMTSVEGADGEKGGGIDLGPGAFLQIYRDKNGEDAIGYAEPSGKSFDLLSGRITQQREGMFRSVHQMAVSADGNATRAQMSGESKEQDWRATEVVMSAYAAVLRPFITNTLRLVSKIREGGRGKELVPTVAGLAGWHEEDLGRWLLAAAQATEALRMSETFHRMVAKAQARKVLPHADPALMRKVEEEIDAADVNLDEVAAMLGGGGQFGVGSFNLDGGGGGGDGGGSE